MDSLLTYTLERLDSLKRFYNLEKKSIDTKSKKGMDINRFGFLIDIYLLTLMYGSKEEQSNESFKSLVSYANKYVDIVEIKDVNEQTKNVEFKLKNIEELKKNKFNIDIKDASISYREFEDMPRIHQNNTLIMLLIRFEEFISSFMKRLYEMFPDKYLNNQQISFSEIENIGTDKIKEKIILREIDSLMRKSYEVWFKIFDEHGMRLSGCSKELNDLKEIYARRNILVHNSGKVNDTYLKNVPESKNKLGDYLNADDKYLINAFSCVKIIIYFIMIQATHIIKDDKEDYLSNVFRCAYKEMCDGNYIVSISIFNTLSKNKLLSDEMCVMSKINYWISKKEIKEFDEVKEDIQKFDVSALDKKFVLAKAVLLEDYDFVTIILTDMLEKNEFFADALEKWPLFIKYRKTKQYKDLRNMYIEHFDVNVLETDSENVPTPVNKSIRNEIKEASE